MAKRIEEINASLADREKRIAELEAMFARPDQFDEPDQIAASGKQYRALKDEAQSLWDEWERLSSEAENIDSQLAGIKTG